MKTTYGMSKGKGLAYEPATKGQWPEEQLWSTEKYLDFTPKLFEAVRDKFGFNEHLLHDMHHRLTPIEAARFGKSIEQYRLFWMEDPTPKPGVLPPDPPAYRHADCGRGSVQ
jgi:mannonate dehydratase